MQCIRLKYMIVHVNIMYIKDVMYTKDVQIMARKIHNLSDKEVKHERRCNRKRCKNSDR
ncbi:MAG: hypothetical protein ACOYJI_00010 [Anaerovoracaceae bacterium]